MKNTVSLKLNRDFKRLYYKGKSSAGGYVVVYAMKNRLGTNRLGLTAGKTVGNAVLRNRIKRLMRESYRLMEDRLAVGYDIVMVSRSRAPSQSLDKIKKDTAFAMKKLGLFRDLLQ